MVRLSAPASGVSLISGALAASLPSFSPIREAPAGGEASSVECGVDHGLPAGRMVRHQLGRVGIRQIPQEAEALHVVDAAQEQRPVADAVLRPAEHAVGLVRSSVYWSILPTQEEPPGVPVHWSYRKARAAVVSSSYTAGMTVTLSDTTLRYVLPPGPLGKATQPHSSAMSAISELSLKPP